MGSEEIFKEISLRNILLYESSGRFASVLSSRSNTIGSSRVVATHITKRQLLLEY